MKARWLVPAVLVLIASQIVFAGSSGQSKDRILPNRSEQQESWAVPKDGRSPPRAVTYLETHLFTETIVQGNDSPQHTFSVPSNADYVLVTVAMKENHDFDLSLWDNQNRRTGGWTSTESSTRTDIPNSDYSGWSNYGHRIREWITVKPTTTSGTWKAGCYSYSGDGTYTIRVEVRGGYTEEGTKEVGVEWVNDYEGKDRDRQHRDDSAKDFRDNLSGEGWTKSYTWSQSSVWELDYKSALYENGLEESYTDRVDIALFAGHGAESTPWDDDALMSYDAGALSLNSQVYDSKVAPHDAYMSWGDQDLEWIGLDACHVLKSPWEWAQVMNGLHLICGFANRSYEDCLFGKWNNMGQHWSRYMINEALFDRAKTIKQSWFYAADDVMGTQALLTGKCITARVIGENNACGDDYLHGQGSSTSDPDHDNSYKKWDHKVGWCCPPIVYHPTGDDTVMLYRVITPTVNETTVAGIGAIFGITGDVHTELVNGVTHYYMALDDATLVVTENGGIKYMDGSSLWTTVSTQPALPSVNEAQDIAENFLHSNGLMPTDAVFFSVIEDTQTEAYSVIPQSRPPGEEPTEEEHVIETLVTNYQVTFERSIEEFPVSSQLSVYIGEGGAIVGLKKNWREVESDSVTALIPEDDAWDLLTTYNSRFSVHGFPTEGPIEKLGGGLAYYDFCDGVLQDYLMPVYVFDVDLVADTGVERIAVPAVYSFVAPIPVITAPADESVFDWEVPIEFTGTCLYGAPPYTYEWSSNVDGDLGTEQTIEVADLSPGRHTITLLGTDANGATKKDMVSLTILYELDSVKEAEPKSGFALTTLSRNPASGPVRIEYTVARQTPVRIGVYDIQGREVARLVDGVIPAGRYQTTWNATRLGQPLPAGLYLVRYQAAEEVISRRLILVR